MSKDRSHPVFTYFKLVYNLSVNLYCCNSILCVFRQLNFGYLHPQLGAAILLRQILYCDELSAYFEVKGLLFQTLVIHFTTTLDALKEPAETKLL